MDLQNIMNKFKTLINEKNFATSPEYSCDEDILKISFHTQLGDLDDDVYVGIHVYPNGGFIVDYIFDRFDLNVDTCEFINQYNRNVLFFKAFVNENEYLEIAATTMESKDEDDVFHKIVYLMNYIVNDDNYEFLKPLTEITE